MFELPLNIFVKKSLTNLQSFHVRKQERPVPRSHHSSFRHMSHWSRRGAPSYNEAKNNIWGGFVLVYFISLFILCSPFVPVFHPGFYAVVKKTSHFCGHLWIIQHAAMLAESGFFNAALRRGYQMDKQCLCRRRHLTHPLALHVTHIYFFF